MTMYWYRNTTYNDFDTVYGIVEAETYNDAAAVARKRLALDKDNIAYYGVFEYYDNFNKHPGVEAAMKIHLDIIKTYRKVLKKIGL
jgi:hypothetical protein